MGLLRIDHKTLSRKVYEQLKQKMITAELMPGERISLRAIASQLGVSLTPVREAMWQLERDKAVVIEYNRQIVVNQLSIGDFDELLELRLLLEGKAAEVACIRREEANLESVRTALDEMAQSLSDSRSYLHHNHHFHMEIYRSSRMNNLVGLIDNLWTRVGPYIYQATTRSDRRLRSMRFHQMMYEALLARDSHRMLEALRLDLTTAAAEIRPLLVRRDGAELGPSRTADGGAARRLSDGPLARRAKTP
jgi:DNA-binding GntR family transcriptional regulator